MSEQLGPRQRESEDTPDVETPVAFRPARVDPRDSEDQPSASEESRATLVAIHAHNVALDNAPTVPRFAWNALATNRDEPTSRRFRLFRGRTRSASSTTAPGWRKRRRLSVDWDAFFFNLLGSWLVLLLTWFWVAYVLFCCAYVLREDIHVFAWSTAVATVALVTYGCFFALVWLALTPMVNGSFRLLLSSRRRKQLEHQFELAIPTSLRQLTLSDADLGAHNLATPPQQQQLSDGWRQKHSTMATPLNNANVSRAQSALGALPLLVWSAQANSAAHLSSEKRRHTEHELMAKVPDWQQQSTAHRGSMSQSPPPPSDPPSVTVKRAGSASAGMQNVLHAISQPDIGFGERRGTARLAGAGKLPQIREERAREAGKLFSESDWQALLDIDTKEGDSRSFLREWVQTKHLKVKRRLVEFTQMPTFTVSVILRNILWVALYIWAIGSLDRVSYEDPWNYGALPRQFHWVENLFQWQLSLDYVLLFLAANEKWRYLLSFTGLVDVITLPMAQATIELLTRRYYPYFSLAFGSIRLFRLFRLEKMIGSVFPHIDNVRLIFLGLIVDTAVVVLTFACSMYVVEAPRAVNDFDHVVDFVYYSIVTMTTVGYGDYSPRTRLARWITSAAILGGFIIFPYHVQRLLSALHIPPVCVGRMPSLSADFIFIYGKIRPRQLGVILHNLAEVLPGSVRHVLVVTPFPAISFKPLTVDFARRKAIKVCVSQKCPSSEEMQLYCALARTVLIIADPKGASQSHLTTADATAKLLAEDQKAFLKLTKAQPWCWPAVPITVQLAHGLYNDLTTEIGAYHVVSLEQLKLKCIGKTVTGCLGFIPLLFNLYHAPSSDSLLVKFFEHIERKSFYTESLLAKQADAKDEARKDQKYAEEALNVSGEAADGVAVPVSSSDSDEGPEAKLKERMRTWRRANSRRASSRVQASVDLQTRDEDRALENEMNFYHFFRGLRFQVYRMEFPPCMYGVDFSLAVRLIYRRYQLFLIGLVTVDKKFIINPVGYRIGVEKVHLGSHIASGLAFPVAGIVFASSLSDVVRVSKLKTFHVAKHMADTEGKFNTRNHRSPEDLKHAIHAFLDVLAKTKRAEATTTQKPMPKGFLDHLPGSQKRSSWDIRKIVNLQPSTPQEEVPEQEAARADDPVIKEVTSAVEAFDLTHRSERALVVCCGWPKDLHALLSAIDSGRPTNTIILGATDGPAYIRWARELEPFASSCAWVAGSPLSIEDLKNAGVLLADAIVIFSTQHAMSDDATQATTPIDNQVVLVRQQLFALFARVKEYLKTLDLEEVEASSPAAAEATKISKFKVPLIFTELQERENVEYLSSPKDLFLLSAFRNFSKHDSRQSRTLVTHLSGQDHADDIEWALEGGRTPEQAESSLRFNCIRSPLDFTHYAIQSEYRAGRLWLREMTYPLVGYTLPISRYAVDTSFAEHLVDGSHSPLAHFVRGKRAKSPQLQPYRPRSPLSLIPVPRIFNVDGTLFRDVFSYLMKVELKLVIAVLRSISEGPLKSSNPIEYLRGTEASELLISCPSPTMPLNEGDRLYVLSACPKFTCGLFYYEK